MCFVLRNGNQKLPYLKLNFRECQGHIGDTVRFEQYKAQQHRVADSPPNGPDGVAAGGDTLAVFYIQ